MIFWKKPTAFLFKASTSTLSFSSDSIGLTLAIPSSSTLSTSTREIPWIINLTEPPVIFSIRIMAPTVPIL